MPTSGFQRRQGGQAIKNQSKIDLFECEREFKRSKIDQKSIKVSRLANEGQERQVPISGFQRVRKCDRGSIQSLSVAQLSTESLSIVAKMYEKHWVFIDFSTFDC